MGIEQRESDQQFGLTAGFKADAERSAKLDDLFDDVSLLVTNQPNPIFLRNWREALQVPAERHLDTFAEHGNLFGAGIPVCLDRAVQQGRLSDGDNVVLGGFSHAGDYAAAAVVRRRRTLGQRGDGDAAQGRFGTPRDRSGPAHPSGPRLHTADGAQSHRGTC